MELRPPNIQMEPTLHRPRVVVSPRRAAHLARRVPINAEANPNSDDALSEIPWRLERSRWRGAADAQPDHSWQDTVLDRQEVSVTKLLNPGPSLD
jgi:hypothetical protein